MAWRREICSPNKYLYPQGKSICNHSSKKESLRGVPYVGIEVGGQSTGQVEEAWQGHENTKW